MAWLEIGRAGLNIFHLNGKWRIGFGAADIPNLFGNLALKLMFRIAETEDVAFCSTCQGMYTPDRRPSAGRGNYCNVCKKDGTMWKEIKRRQRRRNDD